MPPALLFTDWDGTVTLQDSNDMLTDNLGMGHPARMLLNDRIISNEMTFRDAFQAMLKSVSNNGHTLDECIDYLLKNIKLDPGFKETVEFCQSKGIPVIVVSSGMDKIIESLLHKLITEKRLQDSIEIYSNHVKVSHHSWDIVYRDDSSFGHDKNQSILHACKKYGPVPNGMKFYCGDGVSDVSAARSCDLLFAKSGHDLVDICIRDDINYIEFNSFHDILEKIKEKLE
jgi:2,3-diketo-5-methylthio-1-phosphopentane phosphatase